MSLPKEPRQKMINMMYLVLTALLALNVSAEILNAFKVVDKSLQNSSTNLSAANETLYASLLDKLNDPKTADDAKIWQPKADIAKKLSADMSSYIEGLKLELKKEADLQIIKDKDGNNVEDFREDNLDAATRLFDTKGRGKELEAKLLAYKQAMLDIDPEIKAKFATSLPVDVTPVKGHDGITRDFTTSFFHMTPTVAALTILSKFQNNVKNAENQVVSHIHSKIGAVKVKFDKFGVLVGQSSNYLMPGQEIEITAGIGAYSSAAAPVISINGSGVPTIDGKGTYKTQAGGAGAHKIAVVIHYKDQNGADQTASQDIEYTVGTPGGTAVMLDKMNVFYIGVDNPVTINSGAGDEKTNATITSGLIHKVSPGHYVVTQTAPSPKVTINVTADGKTTPFDFKVKNIPPPILMVGPSEGGAMQSVVFKNQPACRAQLNNFDFDYRYSVVSATVYFSGANFPSVQQASITGGSLAGLAAQLAKCIPGTSVNFDNVKVQGPGGPVISIPGPGFILR